MRLAAAIVLLTAGIGTAAPVPKAPPPDAYGNGYFGIWFSEENELSVGRLVPGGPAEAAGFLPGDVLVRVGRLSPRTRLDVQLHVGNCRPGTALAVVVNRGGERRTLVVTVAAMPPDVQATFQSLRARRADDSP